MRYFIVLLAALLMGFTATGQVSAQQSDRENLSTDALLNLPFTDRIPRVSSTEVKGSPFLYEVFYEGTVTLEDGRITDPIPIRYNSYENRVEYQDGIYTLAIPGDDVREFEFRANGEHYHFIKGYEARRLDSEKFVRILVDGPLRFFVSHTTNFHEDIPAYGQATQLDEYVDDVNYYLKKRNGEIERLRLRERNIMRTVDYHEEEMTAFADENNINFSNPDDVVKFFNHYNSLLEGS